MFILIPCGQINIILKIISIIAEFVFLFNICQICLLFLVVTLGSFVIYDFYHFTSIRESDGDETFKASFVLRFIVIFIIFNIHIYVLCEMFIDAFVEL
jgi:hypothetical protein